MLPCELQCQTATLQAVELLGKFTNFFSLSWYQLLEALSKRGINYLTANLSHHHLDYLDYLYTRFCLTIALIIAYKGYIVQNIIASLPNI